MHSPFGKYITHEILEGGLKWESFPLIASSVIIESQELSFQVDRSSNINIRYVAILPNIIKGNRDGEEGGKRI